MSADALISASPAERIVPSATRRKMTPLAATVAPLLFFSRRLSPRPHADKDVWGRGGGGAECGRRGGRRGAPPHPMITLAQFEKCRGLTQNEALACYIQQRDIVYIYILFFFLFFFKVKKIENHRMI